MEAHVSTIQKPSFRYEQTQDRQVNDLQRGLARQILPFSRHPWAYGAQVGPFTFTAGQIITANHPLGKIPTGFFPVDVTGGYGSFQRVPQSATLDATTIKIQAQNACAATFWVY